MQTERKRTLKQVITPIVTMLLYLLTKTFEDSVSFKIQSEVIKELIHIIPYLILAIGIIIIPVLYIKWKIEDFVEQQNRINRVLHKLVIPHMLLKDAELKEVAALTKFDFNLLKELDLPEELSTFIDGLIFQQKFFPPQK